MWKVKEYAARGCVLTGLQFYTHRCRANSHAPFWPGTAAGSIQLR